MLFITYFLLCYFFVNTLGQNPGCPENVQTIPEFDGNKVGTYMVGTYYISTYYFEIGLKMYFINIPNLHSKSLLLKFIFENSM